MAPRKLGASLHPSLPTYTLLLLLALLIHPAHTADEFDALPEKDRVTCVYPVSGHYAPVSRYVYYTLLLFGIVARHSHWLIAGALATAMTYSGAAAIHAIILAATTNNVVQDLDLMGVWTVLGAGAFALWPVLSVSSTLRSSRFRPIFGAWALMICAGMLAAVVPLHLLRPTEPACRARDTGELMTQAYEIGDPAFNCSYKCFDSQRLLRGPDEITILLTSQAFGDNYQKVRALAGYSVNAATVVTILFIPWPRAWTCKWGRKQAQREEEWLIAHKTLMRSPQHWRRMTVLQKGSSIAFFANQLISLITMAFNEMYLLGSGLPMDEQPYGIDQWGSAVAVCLAIIASGLNRYIRQKSAAKEAEKRAISLQLTEARSFTLKEARTFKLREARSWATQGPIKETPPTVFQKFLKWFHRLRTPQHDVETGSIASTRPTLKRYPTW